MKWYKTTQDLSPVISCRVRLARNFKNYKFSHRLDSNHAQQMIEQLNNSLCEQHDIAFKYTDINNHREIDKISLVEHHKISLDLLYGDKPRGLLSSADDTIHIMLNEEDHVRIQCISDGKNIQSVYDKAAYVDDLIESVMEYAFDEQLGYLTSCPSNIGTGLRASYMVHLPMLERAGKIDSIISSITRAGLTMRGMYGETSDFMGSIYQISNQSSLGRSEQDILYLLENFTNKIVEAELEALTKYIAKNPIHFEDHVYRAYGILKNARQIDVIEARKLLSSVRVGAVSGVLKPELTGISVYGIMMNIEYGNLCLNMGYMADNEVNRTRATFIRKALGEVTPTPIDATPPEPIA